MSCTVANCEAKCFGMVTLKILTTTCLCYNSDKIPSFRNESKQS